MIALCLLLLAADPAYDRLLEEAVALKARGDLEGTLAKLEEAERIRPHFKISHNIGAVLEELGRYAEAHAAYRKVTADPAAPAQVAAEDAQRLFRLEPKLGSAWLMLEAIPGAELFVDGERWALGEEARLAPGAHVFETRTPAKVELAAFSLPAGRRTKLLLGYALREAKSVVLLEGAAGQQYSALELDGYLPRGVLAQAQELWVEPGEHTLAVEHAVHGRQVVRRAFVAGERLRLVDLFQGTAVQVASAPTDEPTPLAGWIVGGGGAVLAIAGAALLISADSDRSAVKDAVREDKVITGITMRDADTRHEGAKTKTVAGSATIGVAAALLTVGAVLIF